MFTFTTSSSKPTKRVRCHNCGWTAKGNTEQTFKKADTHVCGDSASPDEESAS